MRFRTVFLWLLLGSVGFALPADDTPLPVLDRIENPESLTVLVFDASGNRAVGARPAGEKGRRSVVTFYSTSDTEVVTVEVPTQVRALLLARDNLSVFAIMRKDAKRGEGETSLALVDPGSAKVKRLIRLPHSAVDLDHWPARNSLLVSCKNEIRTLLMPDMRSGPLYRVRGNNRAIASIPGSNLILVGQDEALLLVDLDATQGKEEMPVQSEIPLPQPVQAISAAPDGSYALVTMTDDSVQTVNIDTLMPAAPPEPEPEPVVVPEIVEEAAIEEVVQEPKLEPLAVEEVVEELPEPEPVPTVLEPVVVAEVIEEPAPEPVAVEEVIEELPDPVVVPELVEEAAIEEVVQEPKLEPLAVEEVVEELPEPEPAPTVLEPVVVAEVIEEPAVEEVVQEPEPEPIVVEEVIEELPEPAAVPEVIEEPAVEEVVQEPTPQVHGKITGDLGSVVAVVLHGPNNMLREAARISPKDNGTWSASGLAAGKYRVQLDGGGSHVLLTDPPFILIDVTESETADAGEIRLLKRL